MEMIITSILAFSFVTVIAVDTLQKRREYLRKRNNV